MSSKFTIAILLVLGLMAAPSSAATLDIQMGGVDVVYDGTNMYDAGGNNSVRGGLPSQSDRLNQVAFFLDGVQVGDLLLDGNGDEIYFDMFLANVPNIPIGGTVNVDPVPDAFGFDLLIGGTWGVGLDIVDLTLVGGYDAGSGSVGPQVTIVGLGNATQVGGQLLPIGLGLGDPVRISLQVDATAWTLTPAGDPEFITSFVAAGGGTMKGTAIPEPATLVIWSLLGLFSMGAYGWRRRSGAWRKGTTESIHEIIDGKRG